MFILRKKVVFTLYHYNKYLVILNSFKYYKVWCFIHYFSTFNNISKQTNSCTCVCDTAKTQ